MEDSVGYWVQIVHRAMRTAFEGRLAEHGLTTPEWAVLAVCRDGPTTPAAVAARMAVSRALVSRLVDGLVAKGLAGRAPHPTDGRSAVVALTARGRDVVPVLAAASRAVNEQFLAPLPAADRPELLRLLRAVGEAARAARPADE